MKGSIQQKGKVFYAVIAVNGKRKWFKGGGTEKAAQRKLNEVLPEIDQGTYRDLTKATFSEFSQVWLRNYAEPRVKPSTLAGYKDIIKRLFIPSFGNYSMPDIVTGHLQAFVADLLKSVSAKTTTNEVVVMKEMFKHALRQGYLKHNPPNTSNVPALLRPKSKY